MTIREIFYGLTENGESRKENCEEQQLSVVLIVAGAIQPLVVRTIANVPSHT